MKEAKLKSIFIPIMLSILCVSFVLALSITLNHPNDEWVLSNSVLVNFTPLSPDGSLAWCAVYSNDTGTYSLKANYTSVPNGTEYVSGISFADSIGKVYTANVTCYNGSNSVSTGAFFGVDGTVPSITLDSPADQSYLPSNNTLLVYTPTDSSNLDTCLLYTNISGAWAINQTNKTNSSGAQIVMNLTKSNVADGFYKWNVWCNDSGLNTEWAEDTNRTFTIDSVKPSSIKFLTANNTYSRNSTPVIVWNQTTDANFRRYNLAVYPYHNMSNPIQTVTITNRTANSTVLSNIEHDGVYYILVDAEDYAGNIRNTTYILYYNLDTASPTVTINYPLNNTYTSDTTPDFNATMVNTHLDTCILWLSNNSGEGIMINNTYRGMSNNTQFNMTKSVALQDGTYKFNIGCNDSAGIMVNASAKDLDLIIDTVPPTQPNIISTWGGKNNTDKTPVLEWGSSTEINFDRYTVNAYYLNYSKAYEINITSRTTNFSSLVLPVEKSYFFNVTAYDLAGNKNVSLNTTTQTCYYVDSVCGTLNVGWNLCGATWITAKNLSRIGAETSAKFVTVWNISNHAWATCNYAASSIGSNCEIEVLINNSNSNAVWVYVNVSTEWRNRTWEAHANSTNITLSNASNIGWNIIAGFFRNGKSFQKLGDKFTTNNVSMFSLPYNNGTSISYVNKYPFSAMSVNVTLLDYGRAMWVYYNGSITTATWTDVGGW